MRLSVDDAAGRDTIVAALRAGVTLLDTARAYEENERLVAAAIANCGISRSAIRVVTKCGMRRPEGQWVPDGRAGAILEDARESADILGQLDVLLLHAPDPRVDLATSVRALEKARAEGLTRRIGLSNVTRAQLIEAEGVARIDAVQIALGAFDDVAARGGLLTYCVERGIEVLAHSPLGGPKRAPKLARDHVLSALSQSLGLNAKELVLAYLLHVHSAIVPISGARTPESAARLPMVANTALDDEVLAKLDARFPALGAIRKPPARPIESDREVVMLMGIPGSGKSTATSRYRGYLHLNRDSMGGTLRRVNNALARALDEGATQVVLDNTYVTRASRSDVIQLAHNKGAHVRCVWVDTPMAQAQLNVVLRILEKYGRLLEPDEMTVFAKKDENLVRPTVLFRMARELEPPELDEGFTEIDVVPFVREKRARWSQPGVLISLDAVERVTNAPDVPCLVFGWDPDRTVDRARIAERLPHADVRICTHPAGPPVCWCRPPLPGLVVSFLEQHGVDPEKSVMIAGSPSHEAIARALAIRVTNP